MSNIHDYDKILTRLTIILQRLYEGEKLSVSELAEEFNVSTKTIQRDFNERLYRFPIVKVGRKWKMQDGRQYPLTRSGLLYIQVFLSSVRQQLSSLPH